MKKMPHHLNFIVKDQSSYGFKEDQKAFSLLELLIALTIAILLWGCAGYLFVSIQSKLRTVMDSNMGRIASVNMQFQSDIHSAMKFTTLTPNRLTFELPDGAGSYEYYKGCLYREFKGVRAERLNHIVSSKWECISEENGENADLDKCGVVFWNYTFKEDNHKIYAVKKIS